jgi:hypothetical protein
LRAVLPERGLKGEKVVVTLVRYLVSILTDWSRRSTVNLREVAMRVEVIGDVVHCGGSGVSSGLGSASFLRS